MDEMRQKNETATSFNKLREITQAIQAQKNSAQKLAHANTNTLKPTKRAFSERQRTTNRDNSQASAKESQRWR